MSDRRDYNAPTGGSSYSGGGGGGGYDAKPSYGGGQDSYSQKPGGYDQYGGGSGAGGYSQGGYDANGAPGGGSAAGGYGQSSGYRADSYGGGGGGGGAGGYSSGGGAAAGYSSGGGYPGGNSAGYPGGGGGGGGSDSGKQASTDTIYISNLPKHITDQKLIDHFGSIGVIKMDKKDRKGPKPKVWVYRDKSTGVPKGDATVTYEDPHSCEGAINWFNGKQFEGSTIKVERAEAKAPPPGGWATRGGRGGRGGGRGGFSGGPPRDSGKEGDWPCTCGNTNFAWRDSCNRCQAPKPGGGGGGGSAGGPPPSGGGRGGPPGRDGDWACE
ncbi:hypothetical protein HKX48_003074 [Thoreauomyces humboldtii]|nr:hypothetical protein HKX48_003074 [Thoreauomyces humboldtii]